MRRFYFETENQNQNNIILLGEEFNHLKNVLRLKEGTTVVCVCGDGKDYVCQIKEIDKDKALLELLNVLEAETTPKANVSVFQGTLKLDKFELVLQKLAELGVLKVVPFESAFSVAKIKPEKIERYKKISISASKQCKRADFMQVGQKHSFKEMLKALQEYDKVIFAYEKEGQGSLKTLKLEKQEKVAIVVGSEGGFSQAEVEALEKLDNLKTISLGKRILRAETAVIALASLVMFVLDEI